MCEWGGGGSGEITEGNLGCLSGGGGGEGRDD